MKVAGRAGVLVLLCAQLVISVAGRAQACSCGGSWTAEGLEASDADAAFVGVVESHRDEHARQELAFGAPLERWRYRVEKVLKGTLPREIDVWTARDGAACGISADVGRRTGLVLERVAGKWESDMCRQFRPAELGDVRAFAPVDRLGPPAEGVPPALALVLVLPLAAVLYWRLRRRRREPV